MGLWLQNKNLHIEHLNPYGHFEDMPTKKALETSIKLLIAGLLAWAIYRQVFARHDISLLWQGLMQRFGEPQVYWLVAMIILSPVNVVFEALKWQRLARGFAPMPLGQALKSVLCGITIAIFTPNRIGEYGGRILYVPSGVAWKAVIATLVGSLAQLLVIVGMGVLGLLFFSGHVLDTEAYLLSIVFTLGSSLTGLMLFCFFNIDLLVPLVKRLPFVQRFHRYFKHLLVLRSYRKRELAEALSFAFCRYLTYSLQYYFLLKFYGIAAPPLIGLAAIGTIFFVQASIPLPPVMGLLARSEIALFVWGHFSEDQAAILAASFTLFIVNIAVPALLGMIFIGKASILKAIGYESKNNR